MLDKCLEILDRSLDTPLFAIDCTLGLGGHSEAFLKKFPSLFLVGIDKDEEALEIAEKRLGKSGRIAFVHDSFANIASIASSFGKSPDFIFADLGLSSLQIDKAERGFSYMSSGQLDMRMDKSCDLSAKEIINFWSERELERIFKSCQEPRARYLARLIAEERKKGEISTTGELSEILDSHTPFKERMQTKKRVFQAVRMEVNGEKSDLEKLLGSSLQISHPGSLIMIESYHSGEDKIVKSFFSAGISPKVPPKFPLEPEPYFQDLTRGALKAGEEETEKNSRSHSVRLRAVKVLGASERVKNQSL
ncbi:MAG: 16S rRNA (cytosine(1402)-N(4))-methyltransferase RsmH [Bifidobacteriaceae bacterium]|nr:16S rRNA (cytosine(1402)-N(4))-methyltransferase RsmH [Aeriscardovia sp.]MBQ1803732.1 16S rRNA (cytosine(1402)-N(4))-methyltransferase RsmH [Bifidobacteriaceae bacterium]